MTFFANSPAQTLANRNWHYGLVFYVSIVHTVHIIKIIRLGCWFECDTNEFTSDCAERRVFSSTGGLGFYPAISFDGAETDHYWIVVGQNVGEELGGIVVTVIIIVVVLCLLCCAIGGAFHYYRRRKRRIESRGY